jgi:hypothetical protein
VTIHCSICGKADHNKKGHQKYLDRLGEQSQNNIIDEDEELNIPSIVEVHFYFVQIFVAPCKMHNLFCTKFVYSM